MNLFAKLSARADDPIKVGLIGAGKFGSMFLAQAPRTPGMRVSAICDLDPDRARATLGRVGFTDPRTRITDDAETLIAADDVDVVVEATGHPPAGIRHALAAIARRKHIVMVNVEADALAGPLLARRAAQAGAVYSLAYGDQPALIAEMVDWARAAGFTVVAAGKGTKYLPAYHASTPDTVWQHYGLTAEEARAGGMNAQMFNSFLDGTKSAIEMAAVANATGLTPAPDGLAFPAVGVDELPRRLKPPSDGGVLHHAGQVEVVSSVQRDGSPVFRDLRWGVYATFAAPSDYVARCFAEYGLVTDESGKYAAMYKPFHLIGLELGISVASVALRAEPTGAPTGWRGDAVTIAKRDLTPGETLDGEGGYTVWGRLMPATDSLSAGALPIGLAHGVTMTRRVSQGALVRWADVAVDERDQAVRTRREMERMFGKAAPADAAAE
ncbi:MAG TPA: Gfo/Idh/MocA family oxidoreductase [Rhodospirillales bacterium]